MKTGIRIATIALGLTAALAGASTASASPRLALHHGRHAATQGRDEHHDRRSDRRHGVEHRQDRGFNHDERH